MTAEGLPEDAPDEGFELTPVEELEVSPEEDLDAAAAAATEDPFEAEAVEDAPEPYGRSWEFDFEAGRFKRYGGAPAEVYAERSLAMWCLMALHTAVDAHDIFSPEFGTDRPLEPIGSTGADAEEAVGDWEAKIREALTVHDRITDVQDFDADYDPAVGVLTISSFTVVTDEDERVRFGALQLSTVPEAI